MSKITAFKGVRPIPSKAQEIASLPYDVMSKSEAKEMVATNPNSFLTVIRPDVLPNADTASPEQLHQKSKEQLDQLINNNLMSQDTENAIYIYELTMNEHVQTGIMAGVSIDEFNNNLIKKHEQTRPDKENDRTLHIETVGANTGPVLFTYRHQDNISTLVAQITGTEPSTTFTADDTIKHRLWVVTNPETITQIQSGFEKVTALYIADGHHRMAASARVYENKKQNNPNHTGEEAYNYTLGVMFPDSELQILDYNRCIKDLNGNDKEALIEKMQAYFEFKPAQNATEAKPQEAGEFAMFIDQWYTLKVKPNTIQTTDAADSLDAAILQNYVLGPILGIDNPRTNPRIDFVGGIRGLNELEKRCNEDCKVSFALYPTSITQLMSVADANLLMPPKSTWFEPKLRSGMVVRPID